MNKNFTKWFWFTGGFLLGFSLIAIGHASIPKKSVRVTELKVSKAGVPEMDQDFSSLVNQESQYVESSKQQKKLKAVIQRKTRKVSVE